MASGRGIGLLRRFKVSVDAVESMVIQSVANCMDWAKHRRREAAAKMQLPPIWHKQVKQSLKLGSLLGHSANAVRWQVYTALVVDVLLRSMTHLSAWRNSFTRLFVVTCSALWERFDGLHCKI